MAAYTLPEYEDHSDQRLSGFQLCEAGDCLRGDGLFTEAAQQQAADRRSGACFSAVAGGRGGAAADPAPEYAAECAAAALLG
ncbi:hypothetical protein D3C74_412770 [compost metagenome]